MNRRALDKEGGSIEGGAAEGRACLAITDRARGVGSRSPEAETRRAGGVIDGVSGRAATRESNGEADGNFTHGKKGSWSTAGESGGAKEICTALAETEKDRGGRGAGCETTSNTGSAPDVPPAKSAAQRRWRRRKTQHGGAAGRRSRRRGSNGVAPAREWQRWKKTAECVG